MDNKKIGKVLALLHEKSMIYQLDWTEVHDRVYQVSFPNASVTVGQYSDPDHSDQTKYTYIKFFNKFGKMVLEVNGSNIHKYLNQTLIFIKEIYKAAREHTLNKDVKIEYVINSLMPVPEDNSPF